MSTPGATGFGFFGMGLEATKGTAIAASAATFIPVTRGEGDEATDVLPDTGMRGSMATLYGATKGTQSASYEVEGDVFLDDFGFFLAGILGEVAMTGTASPFTHVFTLNNAKTTTFGQCPSYTIFDYNGLQARKYKAATMSSLSIRCTAQELLTYSASFTTHASSTETTPTPSFTTDAPVAGWKGAVTLGGSSNTLVEEMEINLSRNVSVVQTVDGDVTPAQLWQGPLSVSGRLMFLAAAETEFLKYLSVDDGASPDGQVPLQIAFTQGSFSLTLLMTKVVYNSAKVERGADYSQVSAQFDAIANTTDVGTSAGHGPIKATLVTATGGDVFMNTP